MRVLDKKYKEKSELFLLLPQILMKLQMAKTHWRSDYFPLTTAYSPLVKD